MSVGRAAAMLAFAALAACAERREAGVPGELSLEWSSTDTMIGAATWTGRAEAAWCEAEHRLTLFAARGDTGAALLVLLPALEPADSIPLVAATIRDSAGRVDSAASDTNATADTTATPDTATAQDRRATIAVRWSNERGVFAMRSGSGSLALTRTTPTLAGRFEGTLVAQDDESVPPVLRGRLHDVAVTAGDAGCRLAGVGPAPDSGVP
ncbi:MAG TPA: hypothetical protein VFY20_12685 [Gemmatimonadales bacterium]|nr:hypothetical protein [Gemmatimonadales bacterium]